ncbi:MAG: AmmeMemoRadiSam system protein B, partial [Candidatus Pacebacteria bacterium]|nr:AmmeMemoRadiSam system protein B [Candidatus Paceibacterota bacterium]
MKKTEIFFTIITLTAALTAVSYFLLLEKKDFTAVALEVEDSLIAALASPYNSKAMYDEVFDNLPQGQNTQETVYAGVVSHHLLAKEQIAQFYSKISSDKIETIFLLSPDHYNHFFEPGVLAYTSKAPWNTPYGELEADKDAIDELLSSDIVNSKSSAMGLEHGIYTEIPFIKKFFPNAKIVPLALNSSLQYGDFLKLGLELKNISQENTLLIVSSDFSHDATQDKALENDAKSIDELKNIASADIKNITSDCKQCLAVMQTYLADKDLGFNATDSLNSFDISGASPESVTSYVFGYYTQKTDIQILFTGDLMFDRGIRHYAKKAGSNEFIFQKIRPLLLNQDLVISNLEGPITDNASKSSGTEPGSPNNYIFTFDPSVAKTLWYENIRLVGLGNNHILNFGQDGEKSTHEYLEASGVSFFGSPNADRTITKTVQGIKMAFVNYNEFTSTTAFEQSQAITEIQKLKGRVDFIVVFCHWDTEYQPEPTEATKTLAHQFINAGADIIIGS